MPFKLENEFCRLEVIPEAAEITSFSTRQIMLKSCIKEMKAGLEETQVFSLSSVVHIQSIMKFTENNIR